MPPKTEMRERLKMGADGGDVEHAAAGMQSVKVSLVAAETTAAVVVENRKRFIFWGWQRPEQSDPIPMFGSDFA